MHDHLAHLYHLGLRLLVTPLWRPPATALGVAAVCALLWPGRRPVVASLAVLAGWLALVLPGNPFVPIGPVACLPGAAILLALRFSGRLPWPAALSAMLYAVIGAWWLRGAPLQGPAVANLVPVIAGLLVASFIAGRLTVRGGNLATIAAAATLAACILLAGGAPHWAGAALVPAFAAIVLPAAEALLPLAQSVALVAVAAVAASNHGRFLPMDIAAAAPFLVWLLAPRLQPHLTKAGPALAAALAAGCGVLAVWGALLLTRY